MLHDDLAQPSAEDYRQLMRRSAEHEDQLRRVLAECHESSRRTEQLADAYIGITDRFFNGYESIRSDLPQIIRAIEQLSSRTQEIGARVNDTERLVWQLSESVTRRPEPDILTGRPHGPARERPGHEIETSGGSNGIGAPASAQAETVEMSEMHEHLDRVDARLDGLDRRNFFARMVPLFLIVAVLVSYPFLAAITRMPPADMTQYISPVTGLAGAVIGYWFGQTSPGGKSGG